MGAFVDVLIILVLFILLVIILLGDRRRYATIQQDDQGVSICNRAMLDLTGPSNEAQIFQPR
ncbi:hypothetical protein [Chengkuizengella axinellae]|uniref:Uncharacterized protein n=1 Tax=Chengkuizengella axinellae TaxID=3064388 RepID=A0ABT9IV63_9BACL|nr:hypothetical protein [Chengkuizengella sp. 2205SS18-9]MDP5273241.1 hypothetical protein [Chengkuizengella sp. 2205SS18-9]